MWARLKVASEALRDYLREKRARTVRPLPLSAAAHSLLFFLCRRRAQGLRGDDARQPHPSVVTPAPPSTSSRLSAGERIALSPDLGPPRLASAPAGRAAHPLC